MAREGLSLHTAAERPDLWERGIDSASVWPEYNLHGDVLNQLWGRLDQELADFQFVLYDEAEDAIVAEGHTGPFAWDGDDATLPASFDATLQQVFTDLESGAEVTALTALAAETPRGGRRRGLAAEILGAMRSLAERHGLVHLVAPVGRPGRSATRSRRSRTTSAGVARTASCSTRGCGCTSGSAPGSGRRCPSRCGSPAPWPSGSRGRG